MLTIPIDRIVILIEQASQVWAVPENTAPERHGSFQFQSPDGNLEDTFAIAPAFRELSETLGELTSDEAHELLAVAMVGDSDHPEDSWTAALERAQSVSAEEALTALARILILTDAIENGLDRLGYLSADDLVANDDNDDAEVGPAGQEQDWVNDNPEDDEEQD